jgi:hypothetical protein
MILRGSAGRICHLENVKSYMSYLQCTKIIKMLTLNIFVISTKASKWITVFLYLLVLRPTISSLQNIELNCCKITIKKHNISISKWCKSYTNVNEINICLMLIIEHSGSEIHSRNNRLFLCFNLRQNLMLFSLSCSFTCISFLALTIAKILKNG